MTLDKSLKSGDPDVIQNPCEYSLFRVKEIASAILVKAIKKLALPVLVNVQWPQALGRPCGGSEYQLNKLFEWLFSCLTPWRLGFCFCRQ